LKRAWPTGNTVTLAQLRESIKSGGFKSGGSRITATGSPVSDASRLRLDLAPAKSTLIVESDPANPAAFAEARRLADGGPVAVEVSGTVAQGETLLLKSATRN